MLIMFFWLPGNAALVACPPPRLPRIPLWLSLWLLWRHTGQLYSTAQSDLERIPAQHAAARPLHPQPQGEVLPLRMWRFVKCSGGPSPPHSASLAFGAGSLLRHRAYVALPVISSKGFAFGKLPWRETRGNLVVRALLLLMESFCERCCWRAPVKA